MYFEWETHWNFCWMYLFKIMQRGILSGKHTETLLTILVSNYATMYFEWETHWNFVEYTCFKLCNEVFWVGNTLKLCWIYLYQIMQRCTLSGKHSETLLNVLVSNYVTRYFEWETHWNCVECTCIKLCNEVFWVGNKLQLCWIYLF